MNFRSALAFTAAVVVVLGASGATADEGMWTFDNFPSAQVKAKYGVTIDQAWLDRAREGTGRLQSCSASILSNNGLILTNYHCVVRCVRDLSSAQTDYLKTGFSAAAAEERRCPGQVLDVLQSISDVTARVKAVGAGKTGGELTRTLDAAAADLETSACAGKSGYHCQVVTLYGGGQHKLYIYRHYDDLRLVFAPEFKTGFFGGDLDNFNFPRYNLDIGLMRIYENGKPVSTPQHLRWNPVPPKPGEPVFLVGDPADTQRLLTVAELETQRDLVLPFTTIRASERRGRLIRFAEESAENARIAQQPIVRIENTFKVYRGRLAALDDQAFFQTKRDEEAALRAKADPKLVATIGDPWADMAAVQVAYRDLYPAYYTLETDAGSGSQLYGWARGLVRAAEERTKPSPDRLAEYADSRLPQVEHGIFSDTPVEPAIERQSLEFWLSKARETLTVDDPATKRLLGKDSPEAVAQRLVAGSKLADPAVRRALWEGGLKAIQVSDDPVIRYVLATDAAARAVRAQWEARVSGPSASAATRIAQARFAVYGEHLYPDATFTPRITYGAVEGWVEHGQTIYPVTTFAGLYDRATGQPPFDLPESWFKARDTLDLKTPFDFSGTLDIIGGNSGSPAINAKGEVIGEVFDGNIHSLGGDYGYDPLLNRSVQISAAAIQEALFKLYGRADLVKELNDG
jgi:V8-like Glu-specific endopeptidase